MKRIPKFEAALILILVCTTGVYTLIPAEAGSASSFAGMWYTRAVSGTGWGDVIVDISVSGTKISGTPRGDAPSFTGQIVGGQLVGTWTYPKHPTSYTPGEIKIDYFSPYPDSPYPNDRGRWMAYLWTTTDQMVSQWAGYSVKPIWWGETTSETTGETTSKALHVEIDDSNLEENCTLTVTVTDKETGQLVPKVDLEIVVTSQETGRSKTLGIGTPDGRYSWEALLAPEGWFLDPVTDAGRIFLIEVTASRQDYTSDYTSIYVTAPSEDFIREYCPLGPHTTSKTTTNTTATNALYSVFMGDPNDAWAVGVTVNRNGWIVHWDGSGWTLMSSPKDISRNNTLYSVFMVTWDDVWAVGSDGWIIHWDDSSWSNVKSPTRNTLMSVYMSSQNDGWAVGNFGTIIHWDGTSWSNVQSPTKQRLRSISVDHTGTEAFAVGDGGTIIHWTSRTDRWELEEEKAMVAYPREWLNSVFMVDTTDVWAVGNLGQIIHYDGVNSMKWSKVSSPTTNNLNSVFMLSSLQGVAVGDRGTIIYLDLTSDDSWNSIKRSKQADLFSVSIGMITGTHGFAVGQGGNVVALTIQPSYYQPGQTSTSTEKVKYTETRLEGPATTATTATTVNVESSLGGYLPVIVIVIVVAVSALLLARRFVITKRSKLS